MSLQHTLQYANRINQVITKITQTQSGKLLLAIDTVAEVIKNDGIIYIFGCGHSHLIGLDCFYRAGGLANVSAILDTDLMLHNGAAKSSAFEKMEGLAEHIFKRYCITKKDMIFVVSSSGINSVPIEMAEQANINGIKNIAITSSSYFEDKPRHKSGKLLYNTAQMYIDNCVPHGDASVQINEDGLGMAPLSTHASSFILQSILLESAVKCQKDGFTPAVYKSGNIAGGGEYNQALIDRFLPRIKHL